MKEVKIYTIVSDQLSPPITGESFCTDMVRHSDYAELEDKYAALAEDNDKAMESLKQADAVVKLAHEKFSALAAENELARKAVQAFCDVVGDNTEIISELVGRDGVLVILEAMKATGNMPATDAFLAEVRASARNEGINYAASRLAAAFNHGFLDKPVSEVLDVTRMILSEKEDLANDSLPAADGLSGEYAEKAIEEWAAQLRKGVQS
ncbi:TPA: hypothetical protein M8Y56_003543 [Salmonella enterica subsp. enterica serovar Infantis]|nr:hypothetical protein [Salmonella enterica subsp. enterica serovar Bonn]HCD0798511.1 hypothetical protein [Salmonella enterica subsp. enterica serovar Infantis]HCD0856108.1 hypothetical protein [Salmonella enterica subsp. enterica serovar Infantis]HCI3267661.1 hypothetical protein [Salmonella enterica subsp. enterica serovar Infantis]